MDELIAAGVTPGKLKGSEGISLVQGKRKVRLVGDDGTVTKQGRYWEQRTGEQLPAGGFMQQAAVREGNVEFIRLRDGSKGVTRKWDEATGQYSYTRLGNRYYTQLRRNYVVSVPVVVKGTRADKSTYEYRAHILVEKSGLRAKELPLRLRSPERYERVKQMVREEIPDDGVIYEVSEERWVLDRRGGWKVSEETVGTDPDTGEAEAHVVLDRRVGALPLPPPTLLFPEAVCPEAFEQHADNLCAPRQIAALLKRDFDEICDALRDAEHRLTGTDTLEQGVTSRVILQFCREHGLGAAVVHNERVIETLPGKPVLAWTVHEGHCWFYSTPQVRRSLQQRRVGTVTKMRKVQKASATPLAAAWLPWAQKLEEGHYRVDEAELNDVRQWFLAQGRTPQVLMKDSSRPRALLYRMTQARDGTTGTVHIHGMPQHWEETQAWSERLGLEYRGEGLPSMALKALQTLVRRNRERVYLDGEQKAQLLELFEFRCAVCGGASSQFEWDHVARHSESFGESEFQPLCSACHKEKTATESRSLDTDILASSFCPRAWEQYVLSPRPPPLVYRVRALPESLAGFEIADVRRCRKRALELCAHPLPMFCALDQIRERTEPELGDLCFVTARYKHFVHQLGYTGPGWMHRVQAEFLLHHGVLAWPDISHVFSATAHYPADLLAAPLREMEAAWEGSPLAKLAVNSLIGLLSIDETRSYKLRSSRHDSDAPPGCVKQVFHYGDGETIFDFITADTLVSNASTRPLHDLALCSEAMRVGQMLYVIRASKALPYEVKTDSCLYRPQKRRKVELSSLRYCDVHQLRERHEPAEQMRRLDERCAMTANPSHEPLFRCAAAEEKDRMHTEPGLPQRRAEPPDTKLPWRDLEETAAEERVLRGESLLVLGIAGTGKTHYVQGIVERLRHEGKKVSVVSKTHTASRRAGGDTADHWVRRHILHGSATCDYLWIDEVSQVDVGLLNQIAKLCFAPMRFLLSGDFHQFPPIANHWRGSPVPEDALERSALLHALAGGNRVTLTECRRGDRKLFDFYSSLVHGPRAELPVQACVSQAKAIFRATAPARWNLCISHRRRVQINAARNRAEAPPHAVLLEVSGRPARGNGAQSMLLWPGLELFGCGAGCKGVRNGCLYTVESVDPEAMTLTLKEGPALTFEQAKAWLRLSYAQTYASCQGTEFGGSLRLWDCGHKFFTRRHLFVGLSRAKQDAQVSLRD